MRIRARAPATPSKKRRPRAHHRQMTTPRHHAAAPPLTALPLLLLLLLGGPAAAQAPSRDMPPQSSQPGLSAPMVVLLVALIVGFLFIGFFSVYMRRCGRAASPGRGTVIPAAALLALARHEQRSQRGGLDPAVVAAFPTMRYAEAKELRVGGKDAALECAVCLSEFEDDEELRLLPACSHAFHTDCIGEWLAGHVTCPVCRCNLDPEAEELPAAADEVAGSGEEVGSSTGDAEEQRDQVAVDIDVSRGGAGEEEEEEERRREAVELERIGSQRRAVRSRSARVVPRSHSTGHSLAAPRVDGGGADLERFTLLLPEHVRREMVAAAAAGEESLRRTGPGPRGGSRSARSDRWPSLIARTLSSRVPFWSASRRAPPDAAEAAAAAAAAAGGTTTTTERTSKREKTGGAASDGSLTPPKGSVRFDCLGGVGGPAVSAARVGAAAGDSETEDDDEEKAIARHRHA